MICLSVCLSIHDTLMNCADLSKEELWRKEKATSEENLDIETPPKRIQ